MQQIWLEELLRKSDHAEIVLLEQQAMAGQHMLSAVIRHDLALLTPWRQNVTAAEPMQQTQLGQLSRHTLYPELSTDVCRKKIQA